MPWPTELTRGEDGQSDERRQQAVFDGGCAVLVGGEAAKTQAPLWEPLWGALAHRENST